MSICLKRQIILGLQALRDRLYEVYRHYEADCTRSTGLKRQIVRGLQALRDILYEVYRP